VICEKNGINFQDLHFDLLQEIANIGSGSAVTSLSQLVNKKIDMNIPKLQVLEFDQVSEAIGGAENPVCAILVNISSPNINGIMMFLIEHKHSMSLVSMLLKDIEWISNEFGMMEQSAITEIGNILTSSYLIALSSLLGEKIGSSIPYLSIDMAGAILSVPAIEFGKVADKAFFIETIFRGGDPTIDISGYFMLVPDLDSFRFIFDKFGMPV